MPPNSSVTSFNLAEILTAFDCLVLLACGESADGDFIQAAVRLGGDAAELKDASSSVILESQQEQMKLI